VAFRSERKKSSFIPLVEGRGGKKKEAEQIAERAGGKKGNPSFERGSEEKKGPRFSVLRERGIWPPRCNHHARGPQKKKGADDFFYLRRRKKKERVLTFHETRSEKHKKNRFRTFHTRSTDEKIQRLQREGRTHGCSSLQGWRSRSVGKRKKSLSQTGKGECKIPFGCKSKEEGGYRGLKERGKQPSSATIGKKSPRRGRSALKRKGEGPFRRERGRKRAALAFG